MTGITTAANRRWAVLVAATALSLGVAACGDDDESDSGAEEASAEEVSVTAKEYTFDLSATPTAETKSVTFDNQGKEFHVMIFARISEGFTVDEAIKLEGEKGSATVVAETQAKPGATKTAKITEEIEPGNYAMLCPVGGPEGAHYELGQLEEFEIQ